MRFRISIPKHCWTRRFGAIIPGFLTDGMETFMPISNSIYCTKGASHDEVMRYPSKYSTVAVNLHSYDVGHLRRHSLLSPHAILVLTRKVIPLQPLFGKDMLHRSHYLRQLPWATLFHYQTKPLGYSKRQTTSILWGTCDLLRGL